MLVLKKEEEKKRKKEIDSGIFNLLFTKVKYTFEFRFNSVNQCTKLISHSVSSFGQTLQE